ncbi:MULTISPECIES: DUF1127 domain-containing protein [Dickeya]|uniref:DUF1127 domain-containing protein n=1 Tax=Dickeya TaxID=204037 RepID=UPI00054D2D98|nr:MULTISPECIES: DUF1127 domain-containing protein [Dickeya]
MPTHIATTITSFFAPVRFLLRHSYQGLQRWHERKQTRKILSELTDHQLNDIGLTRGSISSLYPTSAGRSVTTHASNASHTRLPALNHKAGKQNRDR